jgi:hypothetical protein
MIREPSLNGICLRHQPLSALPYKLAASQITLNPSEKLNRSSANYPFSLIGIKTTSFKKT